MIKLNEAITNRFPQGNEWATQALAALAGDFDATTLVHDVAEGWMRRGVGAEAELVDTLFILTNDRLGLGQTGGGVGDPRWVPLSAIIAVDAVDDSPLPLQTIEIELQGGLDMCVGWPETFSERLVAVLIALAEGVALDDQADAMPRELTDPDGVVGDVSDLDSLSPSEWVEQPVEQPAEQPAEPVDDLDELPPPTGQRKVVAALDFFNSTPQPRPFESPTDASVDPATADAWTTLDARHDAEPLAPDAFETFDPNGLAEWVEPLAPAAEPTPAPGASPAGPPPWATPGMVWPDPLRGVLYLGGHPAHPRKRKNGTMIFSPKGLEVNGSGFQSWEMSMDWAYVEAMEIQGPDEVMFGDHLKIDSTSSALIVTMADQTRMFFEVRTRRPPSLRAALAPVLNMVENIRAYRAHS